MKTYKSTWHMLNLICKAIGREDFSQTFEAIVEIDETYVGVDEKNTSRVYAVITLPNEVGQTLYGKQLLGILKKVCKDNTTIMTDQLSSYNILDNKWENTSNFVHLKVNHDVCYSFVNSIHTNGIESFGHC
ncbi:MAG: transposase [Bacteroidales bacterium]|nr:transposase [Bacteroidales bacterium]MCF0210239.1 transposase [Bacteroidales bacterium]